MIRKDEEQLLEADGARVTPREGKKVSRNRRADGQGAHNKWPTWRKSWHHPAKSTGSGYGGKCVGCVGKYRVLTRGGTAAVKGAGSQQRLWLFEDKPGALSRPFKQGTPEALMSMKDQTEGSPLSGLGMDADANTADRRPAAVGGQVTGRVVRDGDRRAKPFGENLCFGVRALHRITGARVFPPDGTARCGPGGWLTKYSVSRGDPIRLFIHPRAHTQE